jgi:hypothetical protein
MKRCTEKRPYAYAGEQDEGREEEKNKETTEEHSRVNHTPFSFFLAFEGALLSFSRRSDAARRWAIPTTLSKVRGI